MSDGPHLNDLFPRFDKDSLALMSNDVDEIISIARRGDNLPLASGSICAWWGFLLTATNLYQAFAQSGYLPGPIPISLIQIPLGYVGTFLLMEMEHKRREMLAWRSQVIAATWAFSGVVIVVFMLGAIATGQISDLIANTFLSLIFAINFGVMGTSRLTKWLIYPAIGWIAIAALTFAFKGPPALHSALFGMGSLTFMMAPGLALRLQEKRPVR